MNVTLPSQAALLLGTTLATNVVNSSLTNFGANPIVGTQTTTDNSTRGASTAFVTTAIANAITGVNPATAVFAATTQASDTSSLTYNNGVAGIGATLTGAVNTAVAFDGQTFTALGQRGFVKNDTQSPSGAFNGVYYVTQVQTGILPAILTRALDYDAPSDINNTGTIPVVNGTQANTSWLLTSAVNTVGTDPLTYTKFSLAPSTIMLSRSVNNVSSNTTAAASANTDYVYICTGTMTLTLPTAVSNTNRYTVKNAGTGTLTINTTSSQTMDGVTTFTNSNQYDTFEFVSNNTNWDIL